MADEKGFFNRPHAVSAKSIFAAVRDKLSRRDAWIKADNPGMACKYHNHAEGLLEALEASLGVKPAKDATLGLRLAALSRHA